MISCYSSHMKYNIRNLQQINMCVNSIVTLKLKQLD